MRSHPEKGAALAAKVTQFRDLVPAIRSHHEAWDGSGYPDKLVGDAIPLWARVIMFADTIDAMTTDRPYREALAAESVRQELKAQAGRRSLIPRSQCGASLGQILAATLKGHPIEPRRGTAGDLSVDGPRQSIR